MRRSRTAFIRLLYLVIVGLIVITIATEDAGAIALDARGLPFSSYPPLFGTRESFSTDLKPFFKWTGVMARFRAELSQATAPCPAGIWVACEPVEWRQLLNEIDGLDLRAKLAHVNAALNRYPYALSVRNWGWSDYWETPFEFLRKGGQCQDYAIAKYLVLRAAGVPDALLRVVVLRDLQRRLDHAVLIAYVDGTVLLL